MRLSNLVTPRDTEGFYLPVLAVPAVGGMIGGRGSGLCCGWPKAATVSVLTCPLFKKSGRRADLLLPAGGENTFHLQLLRLDGGQTVFIANEVRIDVTSFQNIHIDFIC